MLPQADFTKQVKKMRDSLDYRWHR